MARTTPQVEYTPAEVVERGKVIYDQSIRRQPAHQCVARDAGLDGMAGELL
ncbi:MAG: hypothetical protein JO250_06505 [Armatimonadetes bacterium]|nr:hypothetical protein [Armatimonadota bacterium]